MKKKLLFLVFLYAFLIVKAQVGIGTDSPSVNTMLHIYSSDKGILIPSMTTAERDANIPSSSSTIDDGLFIYNTIEKCYNYYQISRSAWISICGSYSPAVYNVNCDNIKLYGTYTQGTALNTSNYITASVVVTTPGAYNILASTDNGYYFEKQGVFPEAGTFVITLTGSGTPTTEQTDTITFDFDGTTETCSTSTNGAKTIEVQTPQVSYTITCGSAVVNGTYTAGVILDASENTITIPLSNVDTEGQVSINTSLSNGVYFTSTEDITTSSTSITLTGVGTPTYAGSYTYTFTTNGANPQSCTFTVNFTTTKGTFSDPADRCYDIYSLGMMTDGEYWVKTGSSNSTPTKTYCDMTHGGYTLVWSYSEYTAYNSYTTLSSMAMTDAYRLAVDNSFNIVTTESGTMNYNNFRLPLTTMTNINSQSSSIAPLRVRITETATDMNDSWANDNYVVLTPPSSSESPISGTTNQYEYFYPSTGKIFGQTLTITSNSKTYAGATLGDAAFYYSGIAGYPNHYNFSNNISANNTAFTSPDGTNTLLPSYLNDMFGYFTGTEVNHHFGKCGGSSGDETSFATSYCDYTSLYPHTSFNSGQGRIMQWFIK